MKLIVICKSCQEESPLKEKALSRPDLSYKIGEEFSHRCIHCGNGHKYHVNSVTANKSSSIKLIGTLLGMLIIIAVTLFFFMTGYITNIGLIIGGAVIAASQFSDHTSNVTAFNSYTIELDAIIKHEKLHIRYGHSIEKIMIELFKCIIWWHPIAWYYSRELDLIHEYQVDEAMSTLMDFSEYKKVLIDLVLYPPGLRLVNPISSNIKKRLKMMNQKKQSNSTLRFLGLSALLIIGSISIHSCQKEDASDATIPAKNTIKNAPTKDKKESYVYESIDTIISFNAETYEETVEIIKNESTVYTSPQSMPVFPGCDDLSGEELKECSNQKLLQFIYTNIKYPAESRKAGKEGTIVVQFIVGTTGKLYGTQFKRTVGPEFEDTIDDMLNKMNDEITWIPGKHDGKVVNVQYTLPIKFKLEG